jgi:outer membrane protein OmpA-like peptidoglycan-associated protein
MKRLVTAALVSMLPALALAQEPAPTASPAEEPAARGQEPDSGDDGAYRIDAAPTSTGATGLFRTWQATGLDPGSLSLSMSFDYFSGQDVVRTGDEVRRLLGHLALSWTPIEYLEAFVGVHARAVRNDMGDPDLVQSVGDLNLGLKGIYPVSDAVSIAAMLNVNFPAGAGQVGFDFGATGVDLLAMSTFDLRAAAEVPLRFHVNLGYIIDNTASLFPFVLDRTERFGQGVYDYDRVFIGLAADAPLKYITPSIEWTLQWPNGAQCEALVEQQCVGEVGFSSYPSFLTIGTRGEIVDGLSANVAMDIGLTTAESQGTPAIPGWNLAFGLAYIFNPSEKEPEYVEVPIEVPAAVSHVEGTVVAVGSGEPIEGARVRYVDTEFTDQITGEDGRFRTFDFAPGTEVTIEISHPEYVSTQMNVAITEEVASGVIELESSFTGSLVTGRVVTSTPADAVISFRGAQNYDVEVEDDGTYELELEPGDYRVIAHAPGYRGARSRVTLEAGRHERDWQLDALRPDELFRLTGDGFTFADPAARVTFDADENLTPESMALLDDVGGFLRDEATTGRIIVRSHTDPRETIDEELQLTAMRADRVVGYLIEQGVPAARLEADGVGSAEPLFPNVTDRNRRQNNRVEFRFLFD